MADDQSQSEDAAKTVSLLMDQIASELSEPESLLARLSTEQTDGSRSIPSAGPAPPKTWIEKKLFEIWANMLEFDDFGVDHDFFELGGHSLLAMQIISRARETFGVEIPMSLLWMNDVFSIASMASVVEQVLISQAPQEQLVTAMQELDGRSKV
ncbi:MAG TPA: phosphopantetheine-binding protein [Blastocatellia bacterium]|nr:phosphopantetheine-binding protein [Blastocatellia bacterium]